jgi:hypothetical protein
MIISGKFATHPGRKQFPYQKSLGVQRQSLGVPAASLGVEGGRTASLGVNG